MSFGPERWLDVAEACCTRLADADAEAFLRTAMNRAYYAALLSFKRRIEVAQGPYAIAPRRTHEAIYRAIADGGHRFVDSHRTLRELRRRREEADYELAANAQGIREARNAIRLSRWLIRKRIKALPEAEFHRLRLSAR